MTVLLQFYEIVHLKNDFNADSRKVVSILGKGHTL